MISRADKDTSSSQNQLVGVRVAEDSLVKQADKETGAVWSNNERFLGEMRESCEEHGKPGRYIDWPKVGRLVVATSAMARRPSAESKKKISSGKVKDNGSSKTVQS